MIEFFAWMAALNVLAYLRGQARTTGTRERVPDHTEAVDGVT